VRVGEEGEGGRRGAGRWGQPVRGRERGEARSAGGQEGSWAGVAAGPRVEEKRGEWACAGREKAGPREGEERRVGLAGLSSLFLLLYVFFSILKLFKHNYLNSNKFEFKPYKLNTRKTMLQHECTNMLTL
jgi:hypothetical protein